MNKIHPDWLNWPETVSLIRVFAAQNIPLRFVGGCVRDAWLKKPVTDIDAATPLVPESVMKLLQAAGVKALPTGIDHGTVTAVIGNRSFEITTLRRDTSCDGRHASVAYTDDWKEDAARRDFTINALYLSPDGELFDDVGGIEDLKAGRVRFIGEAKNRIAEDYLRILRFFRFHAWYGKGELDKEALDACAAAASHIETLSGERIQKEMMKLLAAPDPVSSLALMQEYGIAAHVFGGDIDAEILEPVKKLEKEISPLARLGALLGDASRVAWVAERWKLSNHDAAALKNMLQLISADASLTEQKKRLYEAGAASFAQTVLVSAAVAGSTHQYDKMILLPDQWKIPTFPVTGDDLKTLDYKEGRELGDALRKLEEGWQESDYSLTKEQLLARVRR